MESAAKFVSDTLAMWWRDTRLAAAFLTRLPLAPEGAGSGKALADAARAFPIVGAAVGLAAGAALSVASWLGLHPLACALVGLAVAALVTGALHEDGLADVADGFGGGRTRAAKLKIMRDSRIGAYGVLALVFSVGLRAAALAGLPGPGSAVLALMAAGAASRAVLPMVMHRLEPARRDGLAVGAGRPTREDALTSALLGAALVLLFLGPAAGAATVIAAAAAAALVAAQARRQVGGSTGDVLGAVQQVAETAALLAAAALVAP